MITFQPSKDRKIRSLVPALSFPHSPKMDREVGQGSGSAFNVVGAPVLRRGLMKDVTEGVFSAEKEAFDALVQEFAQSARKEVFGALVSKCTKNIWTKVATDASSVSSAAWDNLYTLISTAVEVKAIDVNSDQLWTGALQALHDNDYEDEPSPVRAPEGSAILARFTAFTQALLMRCGIKSFKERPRASKSAVFVAAYYNEPAIILFLDSQGADLLQASGAPRESPAYIAFAARSVEAFTALLDSGKVKATSRFGLCTERDSCREEGNFRLPLIGELFRTAVQGGHDGLRMIRLALQKDSGAKDVAFFAGPDESKIACSGLLNLAILFSRNCDVVRAAIEAGGRMDADGEPKSFDEVEGLVPTLTTAAVALKSNTFEILKMLVEEFDLFKLDHQEAAMWQVKQAKTWPALAVLRFRANLLWGTALV
jgi:hypothetical protein